MMQELVQTLRGLGLLTKRSYPEDARHIVVGLSESGERAAREAGKIMREVEARMAKGLSGTDQRQLLDALEIGLGNLEGGKRNSGPRRGTVIHQHINQESSPKGVNTEDENRRAIRRRSKHSFTPSIGAAGWMEEAPPPHIAVQRKALDLLEEEKGPSDSITDREFIRSLARD